MSSIGECLLWIVSLAWFFQVFYRFGEWIAPSLTPRLVLEVRGGRCRRIHGSIPAHVLRSVGELLRKEGVRRATIKQGRNGRVVFSKGIPDRLHQRLRNVIVSR